MNLTPEDVPGAKFIHANIEDHSIMQLKRWLECRGLQKTGNKKQLIERCKNCIAAGRETIIHVGVDSGKWYDQKFKSSEPVHSAGSASTSTTSEVEIQWAPFPSQNIPEMFNKGHIYAYLVLNTPSQENLTSDSENEGDIPATEKPFRRGQQYVDSGFVNKVCDRICNKNYSVKCVVNSSFKQKVQYKVEIILCGFSGSVLKGVCHCKQSAFGRCSHVSAALLYVWKHVQEYGYKAKSCTSQPQQWGLGTKLRNPASVTTATYPIAPRMKPLERVNFDPRPINYSSNFNINDFLYELEIAGCETMFQSLFSYNYIDFEYNEEEKKIISEQCEIYLKNIINYVFKCNENIVELPGTVGQAGNEKWFHLRTFFITASNAKTVCCFQSSNARTNFIRTNLWCLEDFHVTKPIKYGIDNEKLAREMYRNTLSEDESGLVVNRKYPFIACSVDGVVVKNTNNKKTKIIEIKCPFLLRNCHPKDFQTHLTKKQLQSFILDEKMNVKRNHAYYYQMQICMLIHEVETFDLILWSQSGILTISVQKEPENEVFIQHCLSKIKTFYKTVYVPEMFCMRVPRNLSPVSFDSFE